MRWQDFAEAWLDKGLEAQGVLAPGASAALTRAYQGNLRGRTGSPADFAEFVVGILAGDDPRRVMFFSPSKPPPGTGEHPFKVEADLLAPILGQSGRSELAGRFAVELGNLAFRTRPEDGATVRNPGKIAGRIVGTLLGNRPDWRLLRADLQPDPPAAEGRIRGLLETFKARGYIARDVDVAALAMEPDWLGLGLQKRHDAARALLARLHSSYRGLAAPGVELPRRFEWDDPLVAREENPPADPAAMEELRQFAGNIGF